MNTKQKLIKLGKLQMKVDAIRRDIEIISPGTVTFLARGDVADEEIVVVEADGFGGATASIVEGNYPVDYVTRFARGFPSEPDAEAAAEAVAFQGTSPNRVFGSPDA